METLQVAVSLDGPAADDRRLSLIGGKRRELSRHIIQSHCVGQKSPSSRREHRLQTNSSQRVLAIIMAQLWMATQFDCAYESYPYIDRAADPSLFLSLQQQHDLR